MEKKLLIGFSEKSITPDRPISLAGQFHTRISEYVETPVMVNVMAVETADNCMILCSCDLVSVSSALVRKVRSRITERCADIDTDKIIISATHTHTSLAYGAPEDSTRPAATSCANANTVMPNCKRFVNNTVIGD